MEGKGHKRTRADLYSVHGEENVAAMPAVGRYISKRERAAAQTVPDGSVSRSGPHGRQACQLAPAPLVESTSEIPGRIQREIDEWEEGRGGWSRLPGRLLTRLRGHSRGVNRVKWAPRTGHLLASAGMDHLALIWRPWGPPGSDPVRRIACHAGAVEDLAWSQDATRVVTGSFDCTAKLTEVETGVTLTSFAHQSFVSSVQFHPTDPNLFVSGEAKGGRVRAWDVRDPSTPAWQLSTPDGRILDLEFSRDGSQLLTSLHSSRRGGMDQPIMVWDARKQIQLSNQVYLEGYICPCLRYHPHQESFVAQSHGGYIALFAARPPYKLNKKKRYQGHEVAGYGVQCGFSPDGATLVTGSADGKAYFYSWSSARILKTLAAHSGVCTDATWHLVLPSTVATSSWDGSVAVWE